jgi:hypothetical protein
MNCISPENSGHVEKPLKKREEHHRFCERRYSRTYVLLSILFDLNTKQYTCPASDAPVSRFPFLN